MRSLSGRLGVVAAAATVMVLSSFLIDAVADDLEAENPGDDDREMVAEAAFQDNCAGCHDAGAIARWGEERPDFEDRQEFLDSFLQRHFPPSDDDRALIITYIHETIEPTEADDANGAPRVD